MFEALLMVSTILLLILRFIIFQMWGRAVHVEMEPVGSMNTVTLHRVFQVSHALVLCVLRYQLHHLHQEL